MKIIEEEYYCIANFPQALKKSDITGLPIFYKTKQDKYLMGTVVSIGPAKLIIEVKGFVKRKHYKWQEEGFKFFYVPIGASVQDIINLSQKDKNMDGEEKNNKKQILCEKLKDAILIDKRLLNESDMKSEEEVI